MKETLTLLATIALAIYIIKQLEPIYYFIKDKLAMLKERRKDKLEEQLFNNRAKILLENGWVKMNCGFYKEKNMMTFDNLRRFSDDKFNYISSLEEIEIDFDSLDSYQLEELKKF